MADLPRSTTRLDDTAGPVAVGPKYCAIFAPVPNNADCVPRVYSNSASINAVHGYAPGVDYAAIHLDKTKLPIIFVPLPIATAGVVGRINQSGNSGTSVVSVAVGSAGSLEETDGIVKIVTGGTVGTSSIFFALSLDGGRTFVNVKLGTANSYVIPYVGLTISFAAGTLVAGDTVLTWHSTAPMWDATGMATAKAKMASQKRQTRNWQVMGELSTYSAEAIALVNAVEGYETTNERYTTARIALRDRLPLATVSKQKSVMSGDPSLTFAASGYTITRATGSWVTDGFYVGDTIRVTGSTSNNITLVVTGVTATVLTFASGIANEGPKNGLTITAEPTLTFAEVGATGDTITRNRGSWLADGFRAGDTITISGTSSNNVSGATTAVTATVVTMGSTDLNPETAGVFTASVVTGETDAQCIAALDAAMAQITSKRINLGYGRARIMSPFLNQLMRRNVIWDDCPRAYQHDLHTPTWKKENGPVGSDLTDGIGNTVEHDERTDGNALAAGFTCYRTFGNGPDGTFIALSLTRAPDSSVFSRQHNMDVANLAQSIAQAEAENAIGKNLVLNSDGTPTQESLAKIKSKVDSVLKQQLLTDLEKEGQRASDVYWTPDGTVSLKTPGTKLPAVTTLNLNGTIEQIQQTVKVS